MWGSLTEKYHFHAWDGGRREKKPQRDSSLRGGACLLTVRARPNRPHASCRGLHWPGASRSRSLRMTPRGGWLRGRTVCAWFAARETEKGGRGSAERNTAFGVGPEVGGKKTAERFFAAWRRVPRNGTQEKARPPLRLRMTPRRGWPRGWTVCAWFAARETEKGGRVRRSKRPLSAWEGEWHGAEPPIPSAKAPDESDGFSGALKRSSPC